MYLGYLIVPVFLEAKASLFPTRFFQTLSSLPHVANVRIVYDNTYPAVTILWSVLYKKYDKRSPRIYHDTLQPTRF